MLSRAANKVNKINKKRCGCFAPVVFKMLTMMEKQRGAKSYP
jgi:hypothetical protein